MSKDLELSSTTKRDQERDSFLVHLWKRFSMSDFIPTKPIHMYRWLVGILFVVGISYIILISNLSPYYLINQTQKISILFQNATPWSSNSTSSSIVDATGMDISTQIQWSVIIDGNLTTTQSPQPKDVDIVQYQNMSTTWHHLNDEELRQKGSRAPIKPKGSKIAFMFIVKGTMHFALLWERYFQGHEDQYSIYIHAYPNYIPSFNTTSPFLGRFVPSKEAEWGKVSLQEAENRLLFSALVHDDANNWFLLLSESCIPIDNFPNTYKYITESNHNFIMSFQESKDLRETRLNRGKHWEMAPEVVVDNFRKGSQWFQINRDLAILVANDTTYYNKFVNSFCQPHPVCYIDEHYLPTFLFIMRPEAIASRTLTYFKFHNNSPHPNKWDKTNTNTEILKMIREGHTCSYNGQETNRCHFFARKFDPSALPNLLELAHDVMGIP